VLKVGLRKTLYWKGLKFYRQESMTPRKVGILAGSFNPPTIAHLELGRAASAMVDLVLFVVPRVFPHKEYSGATLEERIEMLGAAGLEFPHAIGLSSDGLFIDIARECREHYGPGVELSFICGRDAAERILRWEYGRAGVLEEMFGQFELLVAPRGGHFLPPQEFGHRIHVLPIGAGHQEVSSTEVRDRLARGEAWEHLVPEKIRERVRRIYS
jgi:cytidyltransferase-like protein